MQASRYRLQSLCERELSYVKVGGVVVNPFRFEKALHRLQYRGTHRLQGRSVSSCQTGALPRCTLPTCSLTGWTRVGQRLVRVSEMGEVYGWSSDSNGVYGVGTIDIQVV